MPVNMLLFITVVVIAALVGFIFLLRWMEYRWMENRLLLPKRAGKATPAVMGLDFERFLIPTRQDQHLRAWFVQAEQNESRPKAALIFHGSSQCISDWVPALHYLSQRGISTMVFDYSGFGESSGNASYGNLRSDAEAAYQAFNSRLPREANKYLIGIDLGAGLILEVSDCFGFDVDGVFLISPFTSGKEALTHYSTFLEKSAFLLPDLFNNLKSVTNLRVPLILIHSEDDEIYPFQMSEQLYLVAKEPKFLVQLHGLRHRDILEGKEALYLAPVADFIH